MAKTKTAEKTATRSLSIDDLKTRIRDVPDFPKKGIVFKDITPVLRDPLAFRALIDRFADRYEAKRPDAILAIESRGFLLGAALADRLGIGLALVRKPKKLPWKTHRVEYALEYGTDALEMHVDALDKGQRVLIVDDLLATGGTASAAISLAKKVGAEVQECAFVIELGFLDGRKRLEPVPSFCLIRY